MKLFIEYVVKGQSGTETVETIFAWTKIAEYKINHVGVSDEVVIDELSKEYLQEQFGDEVSFIGWHRA